MLVLRSTVELHDLAFESLEVQVVLVSLGCEQQWREWLALIGNVVCDRNILLLLLLAELASSHSRVFLVMLVVAVALALQLLVSGSVSMAAAEVAWIECEISDSLFQKLGLFALLDHYLKNAESFIVFGDLLRVVALFVSDKLVGAVLSQNKHSLAFSEVCSHMQWSPASLNQKKYVMMICCCIKYYFSFCSVLADGSLLLKN